MDRESSGGDALSGSEAAGALAERRAGKSAPGRCQRIGDRSYALPSPRHDGRPTRSGCNGAPWTWSVAGAWAHADEAKGSEAIGVPLNDDAMAGLREEQGEHPERVFTYKDRPPGLLNRRSWRNGLKRAGIENFRCHDLQRVGARSHTMAGTSTASAGASMKVAVTAEASAGCRATTIDCRTGSSANGSRGSTVQAKIQPRPNTNLRHSSFGQADRPFAIGKQAAVAH